MSRRASSPPPIAAEIVREYGPYSGSEEVHGVTFDGTRVWFAAGDHLRSFDPKSGESGGSLPVRGTAGTAFDGRHLFQVAGDRIQKIDPDTGEVLATVPAPGGEGVAGLAWAEGVLWVGRYRDRTIHAIDPDTGRILRTVTSTRFVTGVTWVESELWHGTWEDEESELRRIDPDSGEVLARVIMPAGMVVTGVEWDRGDVLLCGGGKSGKVRAVRRGR